MNPLRPLALLRDMPDGAARGFDAEAIFVVRSGNELHAYRDHCPHQGARLPWRKHEYLNHDRTRIVCFAHGAEFDIGTGQCLLGPCLGQSLTRVDLQLTERGEIYVKCGPAEGTRS